MMKINKNILVFLSSLVMPVILVAQSPVLIQRQVTLMGSVFEITLVDKDSTQANLHIDKTISEIERIENLLSEWRVETQISEVNRNAGIRPVKVDREVFELTRRAIVYSEMSCGAFDISIAAIDKIWRFDGSQTTLPTQDDIYKSIENVGYQQIVLDSTMCTIYLKKAGMKIGFGSIGKGYAADKGRELLQQMGVQGGIVNASGDIATWGQQPNLRPWAIGIRNPFRSHKVAKIIRLTNGAIATSGNYEKYVEINNIRYSHIINPKTGYPATGLTSVTIYGESAEFANALSTSIMVLGVKKGAKLLRKFPGYRGIFISDKGKKTTHN